MKRTSTLCLSVITLLTGCAKNNDPVTPPVKYLAKIADAAKPENATEFYYSSSLDFTHSISYYAQQGQTVPTVSAIKLDYTNAQLSGTSSGRNASLTGMSPLYGYEYNGLGQIGKITSRWQSGSVAYYDSITYDATGHIRFIFERTKTGNAWPTLGTAAYLEWVEDNLTGLYIGSGHDSTNLKTKYTHKYLFTYDIGKTNPLQKPAFFVYWNNSVTTMASNAAFNSKNTVLQVNVTIANPSAGVPANQQTSYTYTYGADGYPLTRTRIAGVPVQTLETERFTYQP